MRQPLDQLVLPGHLLETILLFQELTFHFFLIQMALFVLEVAIFGVTFLSFKFQNAQAVLFAACLSKIPVSSCVSSDFFGSVNFTSHGKIHERTISSNSSTDIWMTKLCQSLVFLIILYGAYFIVSIYWILIYSQSTHCHILHWFKIHRIFFRILESSFFPL